MRIGLDCDGCLVDFVGSWLEYVNERMGTAYVPEDITAYHFEECMDISPKQIKRLVQDFCGSDEFWNLPEIDGAKKGLEMLRELGSLHVVTSRLLSETTLTLDCMDRYFPGSIQSVHFTRTEYGAGGSITKAGVCQELGLTHLVEDCRENLLDCVDVLKQGFLIDRPWNQGDLPSNLQRVYSWQDIVDHFYK